MSTVNRSTSAPENNKSQWKLRMHFSDVLMLSYQITFPSLFHSSRQCSLSPPSYLQNTQIKDRSRTTKYLDKSTRGHATLIVHVCRLQTSCNWWLVSSVYEDTIINRLLNMVFPPQIGMFVRKTTYGPYNPRQRRFLQTNVSISGAKHSCCGSYS